MNKTIGIVVAMEKEMRLLPDILTDKERIDAPSFHAVVGMVGDNKVIYALSGIGKVAAAVCAAELIRRYSPDFLINVGVSGGMGDAVELLDTVVSTAVCYHDVSCGCDVAWGQVQGFPLYYPVSDGLLTIIRSLPVPVREGLVCCGDRFLSSSEEQDFVRRTFPDIKAVDMESAAVAQTAYIYDTPFIAMRVISDIAGEGHDNYAEYMAFWRTASPSTFAVLESLLKAI